jgi:hypothetical protein
MLNLFAKKNKDSAGVPETSDVPLKAYVYRDLPEKWNGVSTCGRVFGNFDAHDFYDIYTLEEMVAKACGGGTYRCKVVKSGETKTHIGYHRFVIPGEVLINGEPIVGEHNTADTDEAKPSDTGKRKIVFTDADKVVAAGGVKYDGQKLRMDLIPPEAIEALARIYTYGCNGKPAAAEFPGKAKPYAERNWEKGMDWGRVFAALNRHLWAWWRGEEVDPESGFPHIEHALWNAAALATYRLRKTGTDTRFKAGP